MTWGLPAAPAHAAARPAFEAPFACGKTVRMETGPSHARAPDKLIDMYDPPGAGTPVLASAAGTALTQYRGGGNIAPGGVMVDHGGGWYSLYLHLATRITNGTRVRQGQQIGTVGAVGTGTAHLHYEQLYDSDGSGWAQEGEQVVPVLHGVAYRLSSGGTGQATIVSRNCPQKAVVPPAPKPVTGVVFAGVGGRDPAGKPYLLARRNADGHLLRYTFGRYDKPTDLGGNYRGLTLAGVDDVDGDALPDLVARRDSDNHLLLFAGGRATDLGAGWAGLTFVGVGRGDPAGTPYLLARRDADGHVLLYSLDERRAPIDLGPGPPVSSTDLVGDWTGDGLPDYLTRESDGTMLRTTFADRLPKSLDRWLSEARQLRLLFGRYRPPEDLGAGWLGVTFAGAGDFTGDGRPDILARRHRDGRMLLYVCGPGGRFVGPVDLGRV